MASKQTPASAGRAPRTPPAPSAQATPSVCYEQRLVVLVDWWLERVQGEEGKIRVAGMSDAPQMRRGASSSIGNRKVAGRVFRSAPIAKRNDYTSLETEDGYHIRIVRQLNTPRTSENGFSEEVCECFAFGFPIQWLKLVDRNMEQQNEHAHIESESAANAPRHSVEYYMEKYSSDSFTKYMRYAFTEKDFFSSGNTDGPDGIAGNMAAPCGLNTGRKDMPEKPLTSPGETCSSVQENVQHGRMQIDASEQGIDNHSSRFVSVNQSAGSIYPNSEVDDSIIVPPNIVSVEMEGYRRLRNGKVFGSTSIGPTKRACKQRKIQSVASTADVTSHENGSSASGVLLKMKRNQMIHKDEKDEQST